MKAESERSVVIIEHFYQPPRKAKHNRLAQLSTDPSGIDWNRKIAKQCYIPQLEKGILNTVSFDFYSTMRDEMKQLAPELMPQLHEAMRQRGVGDPYLHVLLPDLNRRDKTILIQAGRNAFLQETGTAPQWLWVPETALDMDTLAVAQRCGYTGVVCAPEQISADRDVSSQPIQISLQGGDKILLLPFDRPFSSELAFHPKLNADEFTQNVIIPRLLRLPMSTPLVGGTDAETFGHHFLLADLFLQYLTEVSLPQVGISVLGINQLLDLWQPEDYVQGKLQERTAWSCPHGNLQRWHGPCGCQDGEQAAWKKPFFESLHLLNDQVSAVLDAELSPSWPDELSRNFAAAYEYQGACNNQLSLFAAKASALAAQTSCGTFFGNPLTSGMICLSNARQAIEHLRDAQHDQLANKLMQELDAGMSKGIDQFTGLPLNELFGELLRAN